MACKKKIPDLPAEIECPNCAEVLEKEEDGKIPRFCSECGEEVPASHWQVSCPVCEHPRKRKKKDKKYAKFCTECKYNYLPKGKICTVCCFNKFKPKSLLLQFLLLVIG